MKFTNNNIWKLLGNIKFSVLLLYFISSIMLVGSIIMKHRSDPFSSLKYNMIQQWLVIYGIKNLSYTWWLIAVIVLLFILTISVAICTIKYTDTSLFLSHLGFILTVIGLFISHTLSIAIFGNVLTEGKQIEIPFTNILLKLKDINIDYFPNRTHFLGMSGSASDCSIVLLIKDQKETHEKKISLNKPCWYKGFTIFIEDFYPKRKINTSPFVNLTIRKDYGIPVIFIGSILFLSGLLGILLR